MARKKVPRTLVPLPSKRLLDQADHKAERLIEVLRAVAVNNQRDQPHTFHSMREIVAHFKVPFATVSRTYGRLEKEGLLTRVRGARTVLQGLHLDRHLEVRAFVGLPASLSAFITIEAYRAFFIKIRRELRLRGFAPTMVFFEKEAARSGTLSERLRTYQVDTVLWFQPPREARETVMRLSDFGIRLICIAHDQAPTIPCRYHVRRDSAINALLSDWKSGNGIDHVTVAQWHEHPAPLLEYSLHVALSEFGLQVSIASFRGQRSETFVQSLKKTKTQAIIFSSAKLASKLCFRAPNAMADLLRTHRVALINGPVNMPFAKIPDVRVDLVVVDWQFVAKQIVEDLVNQNAFGSGDRTIFEAEAKPRVLLKDFAQEI
jgi:hypothetical protein